MKTWVYTVRRSAVPAIIAIFGLHSTARGQSVLQFEQPHEGARFKAGAEVPVQLTAFSPTDVFLGADIYINGVLAARTTFCCWLCPRPACAGSGACCAS